MSLSVTQKQKYSLLVFSILNIWFFIYLAKADYIMSKDSIGYINNHIIRTPTFPLLLDLFQLIFKSSYLSMVVYFQIVSSFVCSYILINTLQKYFKFGEYIFLFLYVTLLYPLYSLKLSNQILPDSLAYSCFILTINFLVVYFFKRNIKSLLTVLLLSVISATIRPQFIFFYGVNLFIILFHIVKSKSLRHGLILFVVFIATVFASSMFQRSYNYIYHGYFLTIPFTGIQLVTPQLYLSDKDDLHVFKDFPEDQRIFLDRVYSEIEERGLNYRGRDKIAMPLAFHYNAAYNVICWNVVATNYFKSENTSQVTPRQFIDLENLMLSVSLKLLSLNYIEFIELYIADIIAGLGFTGSFILCLFTITFIALVIKTKSDIYFLFLMIYIAALANCMLIAMVEPVIKRYTFYTDMLQLVFTTIFLFIYVRDSGQDFFKK
ncbi:hypothetical protein C4544_02055 [candidate division WS5 bacterium]|uniref:Glycosyltransferase RgtA/B/C/D-like domain-containing protein n=1 Tax=candidate division WS5 bacterium TaxID=2093353 RepID=A0A419DET8_9BACT|nr:MAG: hypothetical protein C4544_02055 [candidate division WS5 bacterium]